MYERFYGLREMPFSLTPDPDFLFLGRKHRSGLTMLQYGLLNRAGITVLTGDIGSGKTTLVRRLLNDVGDDIHIGLIASTHAAFGSLMEWVSSAFDLSLQTMSKAALHDLLSRFLIAQYAAGKRTVLIIDEAQNLDATTLEELRLLTNINTAKASLLQLVLVGQPELRQTLRQPDLVQFVQRIGVDFHLSALSVDETEAYIAHRLNVAGGDPNLFECAAKRFIHYQCQGVPRLINALCDTALVYGYADGTRTISPGAILALVNERLQAGLFGAGLIATADDEPSRSQETARLNYDRAMVETGGREATNVA